MCKLYKFILDDGIDDRKLYNITLMLWPKDYDIWLWIAAHDYNFYHSTETFTIFERDHYIILCISNKYFTEHLYSAFKTAKKVN